MEEEYSDEMLEDIQKQAQEWSASFMRTPAFAALTQVQQDWTDAILSSFSEMMYLYHGRRPPKWTATTVGVCCSQTMPRKMSVESEFFMALSPVLAAWFDYLNRAGHIRNGAVLIRAVKRKEKVIVKNADNPAQWGMAKTIVSMAQEAGVNFSSEEDVQAFITRMNSGALGKLDLPGMCMPHEQEAEGAEEEGAEDDFEDIAPILVRFATQIAKKMAKNTPPSFTREMEYFLAKRPHVVFALLTLMVDHVEEHEAPDQGLIAAFLVLMGQQLEEIRYGVDRQFGWAVEMVEAFQAEVVELAVLDRLPPMLLNAIMEAMLAAKLQHSPALLQAHQEMLARTIPGTEMPTREAFVQTLHDFIAHHEEDPFGMSEGFSELVRYMPEEGQSFMMGEFIQTEAPGVKDAAALLILNPDARVRQEVLQWLLQHAKGLTPTALRRLIVMRNWIPEGERGRLDQITKAARKKGVLCAQWEPGEKINKLQASYVDGVGAQGFMVVTSVGRQFRFISVLLKQGVGIADVWMSPLSTKRKLSETMRMVEEGSVIVDVSARYLEVMVRHYIQVGLDAGVPPSLGLLQVAEGMKMTGWLAERCDFQTLLEEIMADAPESDRGVSGVEAILQSSAQWGDVGGVSDSWFEESQQVTEFFQKHKRLGKERLLQKVLTEICEPHRQKWAEKFAQMAFWYNEQPKRHGKKDRLAHSFACVARALFLDRPMAELPLMGAVAQRTINAMRGGVSL